MKADPEKGRAKAAATANNHRNTCSGVPLGPSTSSAKCLTLPVGADLDLDPRRRAAARARLHSRCRESPAARGRPELGGWLGVGAGRSRKRANDKAPAASERKPGLAVTLLDPAISARNGTGAEKQPIESLRKGGLSQ